MDRLAQDIRIALRGVARTPAFTATTICILALGIGMASAMATVFDAVLLRPLPVLDQNRVVSLQPLDQEGVAPSFTLVELDQLRRDSSRTLTGIAAFSHWGAFPFALADGDHALEIPQAVVTGNFFDVLGVRPALGRLLRPEDDVKGAPGVIVLSYETWTHVFGGDSAIIGHRLTNPEVEESLTIIGVAPAGLDYPAHVGAWIPLLYRGQLMNVVGRLAPGATVSDARNEFLTLSQPIGLARRPALRFVNVDVHTLAQEMLGDVKPVLAVLTAAVALLLLIACVNVGNLLLLRASARTREIAVRRALGATRGDVARLLLVESAALAVAGGVVGLALASTLLHTLLILAPAQLPRSDVVGLAGAPVGAAVGVTLIAVLLFGVGPSLSASRLNMAPALQSNARSGSATRRGRRARQSLVASQVALALIMLAGAGLLVRSLERLERQPVGYTVDHLSIVVLTGPMSVYSDTKKLMGMLNQLYPQVRRIPGVTALTPIYVPPLLGRDVGGQIAVEIEGHPRAPSTQAPLVPWEGGGPEYFRTFGIPILRGRGFAEADGPDAPHVAVVSEALARQFFPDEDPIGKRINGPWGWNTVVGVAGDIRFRMLREAAPTLYLPWRQSDSQGCFAVRTVGDLGSVLPAIRRVLQQVDPRVEILRASPMDEFLDVPLARPRLCALLLSGFSLAALVLSAVGLYGAMSATVREQTRELGIRMALGATPGRLRRDVLGRALRVMAVGVATGLLGALVSMRFLSALLFEVSPTDPATLIVVCVILVGVAMAAAYLPARSATRIDPAEALRAE